MRLLNARKLQLVEFFNAPQNIPDYAILSHTWGSDEVSYEDMVNGVAQSKAGYQKIEYACEQAIRDGYEYAWVDTCCIQKSSSSELSEAINSMFEWYRKSGICYAYVEGVTSEEMDIYSQGNEDTNGEQAFCKSKFSQHRWFTRGWTLQELIAPSRVQFYGKDWQSLSSSLNHLKVIQLRTRIDPKVLAADSTAKLKILKSFSVAQRMSWGAERSTTRIEDEAYCLLGLFGVNMPLLYGEGHSAFIRLQEEIMKVSSDQTILAWNSGTESDQCTSSLLAPTVSCFRQCGTLVSLPWQVVPEPFSMTNVGLRIRVPLVASDYAGTKIYLAILSCRYADEPWGPVGLALQNVHRQDEGVPSLYISSHHHWLDFPGFPGHSDGNRTISIAHDGADMQFIVKKEEIILLRQEPTEHSRSTNILGLNSPVPDVATKFYVDEHFGSSWPDAKWMRLINIKSLHPSMHWWKTHSMQDTLFNKFWVE